MQLLSPADLMPLELYAIQRPDFRNRMIEHKRTRSLALGNNARLLFEDRLTVQYQIQEMLLAERIVEPARIQDELDAYNPLLPAGSDLRATLLLEFADPRERLLRLAALGGVEHRVYLRIAARPAIFAHADEDLQRSCAGKTSAVHFLRFDFRQQDIDQLRAGAALEAGIDDPRLPACNKVSAPVREALLSDFGAG